MGLPWFAFNIKDFLANTKRLNTEAKGAYLCLMLDYYEHGEGAPDDDEVLATICELPLERWQRHRLVIAPLFEIKEGRWHHSRIQDEMLKASSKHTKAVAKATAAAHAKHAKSSSKDAPSKPEAKTKRSTPKKSAPSIPDADDKHIFETAHSTLTSTLSNERVAEQNDDNPTKAVDRLVEEESFNPLGTTLPETWTPSDADMATAGAYGMDSEAINAEVLTFHAYNAHHGTFSKNWSATWQMWCSRWKDREAAKPKAPKPRVEVNSSPSEKDWDWAAKTWARGGSVWSYKTLGPEPGQPGCRCPNIFLTKYGIDPKTGRVAKPATEPAS